MPSTSTAGLSPMQDTGAAPPASWSRVVITAVRPSVDGGRWPIKRSLGETLEVEADVVIDGHDHCRAVVLHQAPGAVEPVRTPMRHVHGTLYRATLTPETLGIHTYAVRAWTDAFGTWQDEFERRVKGGEPQGELSIELRVGATLLEPAAAKATGADAEQLKGYIQAFEEGQVQRALTDEVARLARAYDPERGAQESEHLAMDVDPSHARFCAWYEFFPRSSREDGAHGTLDDAAERLPFIKRQGFNIVYLPPIHPIGTTNRKGKDNAPIAGEDDPGSPWAIGGPLKDGTRGGHKAVHPDLGGMPAFERFVARADALDLKVALDIAFQASPDHPYVEAHPSWFNQRPDGSIRYAENPPKKYQDVYPFDFTSEDYPAMWRELKHVFEFWIDHGVRVFRVDNPHTKPLAFWAWCLGTLRAEHPDLVFLAEAFTKPAMMYALAKLGFNNSYTYFTWRNSKYELTSYAEELYQSDVAEFFRPNFWPNTPDILHDYLVHGGRAAHITRLVLAATLSSAYGLYGPPYEHVDNNQHPDREEYARNEKYEVRAWDWDDPHSLQPMIRRVNTIRQDHIALQHMRNIRLHTTDNNQLLAYTKHYDNDLILCVVNLDPHHTQDGWVELPLDALGLSQEQPFGVHDLLSGERYVWQGHHNFVRLDPHVVPAHIFSVEPFN